MTDHTKPEDTQKPTHPANGGHTPMPAGGQVKPEEDKK